MRAKPSVVVIIVSTLALAMGCSDLGGPLGVPQPSGSFTYAGVDLNGNIMSSGTLYLSRQGSQLSGERQLRTVQGSVDTGAISGVIQPDGSIEIMFESCKLVLFHIVLIGKLGPGTIAGIVYAEGESRRIKQGSFTLIPLN